MLIFSNPSFAALEMLTFIWSTSSFVGTVFAETVEALPAKVDPVEVVSVVVMALFLSFAATLYPAWRAARLDPVEALRYE